MTRSEAYADGWNIGRQWAECDIRDGMRNNPNPAWWSGLERAWSLGALRGYRDTWERWDSGALTWEQLEHAPLGA